jgi:hypothetical protein
VQTTPVNLFTPTCSQPGFDAALDELDNATLPHLRLDDRVIVNTHYLRFGTEVEHAGHIVEIHGGGRYSIFSKLLGCSTVTTLFAARDAIVMWTQEGQDRIDADSALFVVYFLLIIFGSLSGVLLIVFGFFFGVYVVITGKCKCKCVQEKRERVNDNVAGTNFAKFLEDFRTSKSGTNIDPAMAKPKSDDIVDWTCADCTCPNAGNLSTCAVCGSTRVVANPLRDSDAGAGGLGGVHTGRNQLE